MGKVGDIISLSEGELTTISANQQWIPTGFLRWRKLKRGKVLEVEWYEQFSRRREWREVPVVTVEEEIDK